MAHTIIVIVAFLVSTGLPLPYVERVVDESQCGNSFVRAYAAAKSEQIGAKFKDYISWQCFDVVEEPPKEESTPAPKTDGA